MSDLSGLWIALVTPFSPSPCGLAVDHAALRGLVAHLKAAGATGFVALGSTGEATSLDEAEQDAVLDTILGAAAGMPVIAGLGGNHVGTLQARLARLNGLPLQGVLCAAPPYVRPSQPALVAHFRSLADASRTPLLLYDIPYRTGVTLALETILALAGHGNIRGIKDCGGSLDKTQQLVADGRLQVLAGEDAMIFPTLCLGGAGAISAAAQVAPRGFAALCKASRPGWLEDARATHHRLMPLVRALFTEPNPALVKAALQRQGLCGPAVRAPLMAASDEATAHLVSHLSTAM